jgi:predicted RNA-binding protein with PUA-like domain
MTILEKIEQDNRSIIVTLPSDVSWEEYEKELERVKDYHEVMNFKVYNFPKGIKRGDKCYIVHKGYVKGWMKITGFSEKRFQCTTTGKEYYGKFIERSGPFHYIEDVIPIRGFQGFRYFNINDYK